MSQLDETFSGTKPVADALKFDQSALERWMAEHVEGFKGPLTVEQFKGGQSNPTYKLSTPGAQYVLRRKPPGKLLPSAHAVDREYRVITALGPTEVPVAKTYALCEDESVLGQIFYEPPDAQHLPWVETAGWLVEDQHFGVVNNGLRKPHTLPIPFGEGAQQTGFHSAKAYALHHITNAHQSVCTRYPAHLSDELEVFTNAQLAIQRWRLRQVPYRPTHSHGLLEHIMATDHRTS